MGRRTVIAAVVAASLGLSAGAVARPVPVRVSGAPRTGAAEVLAVRATDGSIAAARALHGSRATLSAPDGPLVLHALSFAAGGTAREAAAIVGNRGAVRLRLVRSSARGRALAAASPLPAGSVVSVQPIILTPQGGSPQPAPVDVEAGLTTQLFNAWNPLGVKFVDLSPTVLAAIHREEQLAASGVLATPFSSNLLKPDYYVRGTGVAGKDGSVSIDIRVVDPTGAIKATWHVYRPPPRGRRAQHSAARLGDTIASALGAAAADMSAAPPAGSEPSPQPAPSPSGGQSFVRATATGTFFKNQWGSGAVTGPQAGPSVENGYTSVAHGQFGPFADGSSVTLTATPHQNALFDHWEGACSGTQPTCTLTAHGNLDVTAVFAPRVITITIVNPSPQSGEVVGTELGCGLTYTDCSKQEMAATANDSVEYVSAQARNGATFAGFDGCDLVVTLGPLDGRCSFLPSTDRTITVRWG